MNLKKNKEKNEQKVRVCGNVNGMEGTLWGVCIISGEGSACGGGATCCLLPGKG